MIDENLKITVKNGKRRVARAGLKRITELANDTTSFRKKNYDNHTIKNAK